jgi:6-phosphofructokinase 2
MSLIITLTINPAVDKSSRVEHIVPEKKLGCEAPKYEPGGGGINVSRALKRLGTDSTAIFPAAGRTGLRLQDLLKQEGIAQRAVETRNETRENFSVVDISSNQQYRFGMPGPELYPVEAAQFLPLIRGMNPQWLVMSGSLATGLADDFFAEIAHELRKQGTRIILDTSGEALKNTVDAGVYLLKPNLGELSQLVGAESLDMESVAHAARELIGKGKCEIVVVSMGAAGAYLVTKDLTEHVATPTVKKASTVGAGDSMVAGMVHQLAKGASLPEVVRMGVACGTAATMNPGTELFKPEDAERLFGWLMRRI